MSASEGLYSALGRETKSIRLLKLYAPKENDTLRCTLTAHSLDDAPPFIAVSYVWGAPEPSHEIAVNEAAFRVRENLWHALGQLVHIANNEDNCISEQKKSSTKLPQYFWIDAICINQEDTSERGHQVGLMKDIFSTAHLVVAWIGQEEGDIELLFDYLRGLKHTARRERNHYIRSQKRKFTFKDAKWFVSRPYWSRIWIVQEFTLARELWVMCGPSAISWASLQQFRPFGISQQTNLGFKHLSKQENHYSIEKHVESCRELSRLRRSWQTDPKRLSFTDKEPGSGARPRLTRLLAFSKDYHCSDPRDRVYGLLGLTETEGEDRISADYSITPFQLYHRVMFHLKQQGQTFHSQVFRERLAQGLQICDHDDLPASNFIYEAVASRCVRKLLATESNIWRDQFLDDITEHLELEGNRDDPQELLDWVKHHFRSFPLDQDPATWNRFEDALKVALQIADKE
ncbi:HETdomain-containing protein [Colletotrichum tofieldiae]|uniref:HETdomain-containing protein n=1 Tax=Colletotrichum tofieldiae TaxID=708197 RepID=A0A166QE02_9PEZI|nr:HETdomain-containing protein [Colletotrichum tofieldiae]